MNSPTLLQRSFALWSGLTHVLDLAQPAAALAARMYLAQVFFLAGLTKVRDWDTTLLLFTEEYRVPLLSPSIAAVAGTAGELVLPVLLLLGLAGRFAALGLSVVNAVAVISLAEIAPAALQQHITWGVLLAALALYGVGKWSLDCAWIHPQLAARLQRSTGPGVAMN
jgi:putative oxidoreductase